MGSRVAAIDISNPENPQLISQSGLLPGGVTQLIYIQQETESFMLVSVGKFLVVMDTSSTDVLQQVHQLELAGAVSALVWDPLHHIIYAGGSIYHSPSKYSGYISSIELTGDHQLRLIDSMDMPERPLSLALGDTGLYAGAEGYSGGLYYLQITVQGRLTTPLLVIASTPFEPLQPMHMQVFGNRLFLSHRSISAYDITTPNQPELVWSVGGNINKSFNMEADRIYAFGWTILSEYVRYVIQSSEPINEPPVGIPGSVTAMHNGNFMVAFDNLEIYTPIGTDTLQVLGSFTPPAVNAIGISMNEAAVFVMDRGVGFNSLTGSLREFGLPDLSVRGEVALTYPNWNGFRGMTLDNERIYLATGDKLSVYQVGSNGLVFLGDVAISGGGVEAIAVLSDPVRRMLVVAQQAAENSLLTAYDLTSLDNPILVGDPLITEKGEIAQMEERESALFVIRRPAYQIEYVNLDVIRFEDDSLSSKESLQIPGYVVAMAVSDGFIALAGSEAMSVVSARADEPLALLSQTALPEVGVGAAFCGDNVLIAAGGDHGAAQLLVFDINDLAFPRQARALDIPVSQLNSIQMMASGPVVYMANGVGGVEVIRCDP